MFLSHRKAWQEIANGTEPFGAIFEDDAELSPEAHKFLASSDWIPEDADIIKIETENNKVCLGKATHHPHNRNLALLKSKHTCAAGYIISKKVAPLLLKESEQLTMSLDVFLFKMVHPVISSLNIYQLDPALVKQSGVPTQIFERWQKKRLKPIAKLKRELKRAYKDVKRFVYVNGKLRPSGGKYKRVPFK